MNLNRKKKTNAPTTNADPLIQACGILAKVLERKEISRCQAEKLLADFSEEIRKEAITTYVNKGYLDENRMINSLLNSRNNHYGPYYWPLKMKQLGLEEDVFRPYLDVFAWQDLLWEVANRYHGDQNKKQAYLVRLGFGSGMVRELCSRKEQDEEICELDLF